MMNFNKKKIGKILLLSLIPLGIILIIVLGTRKPPIRPEGRVSHQASSYKNNYFAPTNAFDSNPATAWVPANTRDPRFEWIQASWTHPVLISGVRLINGFAKDQNQYKYGAKLKTARVLLSDYSSYFWFLREDQFELQELNFSQTHDISWVKIFIHSVYKGVNEPAEEVGIAEIEFY